MNLLKEVNRVAELMVRFVCYVKASTAMTKTDINKTSEIILIPLFKEIYGYTDLEIKDPNYPGIDLGDRVARVAIQVTSTPTLDKVKHSLKGFISHELYKEYDRVIVYILTEKQGSYNDKVIADIIEQKIKFNVKKDILDCSNLLSKIATFDIEKVSKIKNILEAHFGSLSPFLSSEDFFHSQLDSDDLFNHTWKLEGRSSIIDSLREFVKSENKKVAILPGRGGIGKSKLMYEFGKEFNFSSNFKLWFVEEGVDIRSENVNNLPLVH